MQSAEVGQTRICSQLLLSRACSLRCPESKKVPDLAARDRPKDRTIGDIHTYLEAVDMWPPNDLVQETGSGRANKRHSFYNG